MEHGRSPDSRLYLKKDIEYQRSLAFLESLLNKGGGLSPSDRNYRQLRNKSDIYGHVIRFDLNLRHGTFSVDRIIQKALFRPDGIDIYFGRNAEIKLNDYVFHKIKVVFQQPKGVYIALCSNPKISLGRRLRIELDSMSLI